MSIYSISDLEKLSGVKAHTIRAWELRYHLLEPSRTDGNIRYYNDDELRKLLNISVLVRGGAKISKISKLSKAQLNSIIDGIIEGKEGGDVYASAIINQLIGAGIGYNEHLFEKAFSNAILKYSLIGAYQKVIYPMLVKVGLLWGKSDLMPAQEHFITNLVKQKLYSAIEQVDITMQPKETWLLFLPENEDHELGLLLSNFLIRSSNRHVVYLGQRVPYVNLKSVIEKTKPDFIQYFIVCNQPQEELQEFVNKLKVDFPKIKKGICGSDFMLEAIKLPADHIWISSVNELVALLKAREKIKQN
jgi:DNA-binding transcriptional MerR regulator